MCFEDFMQLNVFQTLGMYESTFLTIDRDLSKICAPHRKSKAKQIEIIKHYPYNRAHAPSSTLTSNLYDIEKWAVAHLNQNMLRPEMYQMVWDEFAIVPNNREKSV